MRTPPSAMAEEPSAAVEQVERGQRVGEVQAGGGGATAIYGEGGVVVGAAGHGFAGLVDALLRGAGDLVAVMVYELGAVDHGFASGGERGAFNEGDGAAFVLLEEREGVAGEFGSVDDEDGVADVEDAGSDESFGGGAGGVEGEGERAAGEREVADWLRAGAGRDVAVFVDSQGGVGERGGVVAGEGEGGVAQFERSGKGCAGVCVEVEG